MVYIIEINKYVYVVSYPLHALQCSCKQNFPCHEWFSCGGFQRQLPTHLWRKTYFWGNFCALDCLVPLGTLTENYFSFPRMIQTNNNNNNNLLHVKCNLLYSFPFSIWYLCFFRFYPCAVKIFYEWRFNFVLPSLGIIVEIVGIVREYNSTRPYGIDETRTGVSLQTDKQTFRQLKVTGRINICGYFISPTPLSYVFVPKQVCYNLIGLLP